MKSSNLLVAFAAMGSVLGGAAAADEKVANAATAVNPEVQAHWNSCIKQQAEIGAEGKVLKAKFNTPEKISKRSCDANEQWAAHDERWVAFVRGCSDVFGWNDVDAGRKILQLSLNAAGLRDGCLPK